MPLRVRSGVTVAHCHANTDGQPDTNANSDEQPDGRAHADTDSDARHAVTHA